MKEIWKDVQGYESKYQVSNLGNVRRFYKGQWLLMKPYCGTSRYFHISFYTNGTPKTFDIHRLVAESFLEKVSGKNEVNHKDGNRKNNSVENLEWVSREENLIHRYRILKDKPVGAKIVLCKTNGKKYDTISAAAQENGISVQYLSYILHKMGGVWAGKTFCFIAK